MNNYYVHLLHLYSWRDGIEVLMLATAVYAASRWLAAGKSKQLLIYTYLICALFGIAYLADLDTIVQFFVMAWPGLLILLFITRMQRVPEYQAPKTIIPAKSSEKEWIPLLLRAMFKGAQYQKDLIFVIEGTHSLTSLLTKPIEVQSNLQHGLLDIIIESSTIKTSGLVWLNHTGTLVGFNGTWQQEIDLEWLTANHEQYSRWEQEALFWTSKTDAIVLRMDPEKRLITIIAQGTHAPGLSTQQAQTVITQYVRKYMYLPSSRSSQPCISR